MTKRMPAPAGEPGSILIPNLGVLRPREAEIMEAIWKLNGQARAGEPAQTGIYEIIETMLKTRAASRRRDSTGTHYNTVNTLLRSLVEDGFLMTEKDPASRTFWYRPLIERDEYIFKTVMTVLDNLEENYAPLLERWLDQRGHSKVVPIRAPELAASA